MSDILKKPVLEFNGNSYELKELTVGSLFDIEAMKSLLSNGTYGEILRHNTILSNYSLDNIDMFSILMVLCPELVEKDLKAKSWRDMHLQDVNELKKEYKSKLLPWFEQQLGFLNPK